MAVLMLMYHNGLDIHLYADISPFNQSFQHAKYDRDVTDRAELEHLRRSPHSTWEASISMETCSSSESLRSANGKRNSLVFAVTVVMELPQIFSCFTFCRNKII